MCSSHCSFIQVPKGPQELLQQRVARRAWQGQLTGLRRGQSEQWHPEQRLPRGREQAGLRPAPTRGPGRPHRQSHQREWHSEWWRWGRPSDPGTGQPYQRHRHSVPEAENLRGPWSSSGRSEAWHWHGRPAGRGAAQTGPGALLCH